MKKNIFITVMLCLCTMSSYSQNLQWSMQIGGPQQEYFSSVTRDNGGNVIVSGIYNDSCDIDPGPGVMMLTGSNPGNQFKQDIFLAKYDPAGNLLWGFSIGGMEGNAVWTVKTDANDDIYMAATYSGTCDFDPGPGTTALTAPSSGAEIYVAKYSKNGNFVWVRDLRGHQHGDNRARDIAFDGMGNLYLTGDFQGSIDLDVGPGQNIVFSSSQGGNSDFAIVKMDTAGNYIWGLTVGGPCLSEALAVDSNGDVYITGSIFGAADFDPGPGTDTEVPMGTRDMFVAGYTSAGAYKWAGLFSSPGNNFARDVVCDGNNNVIFTGIYSGTVDIDPGPGTTSLASNFGGVDGLFVKLTAAGTPVWGHTVGGGSSDWIQAINVDASNNIYLVPQANGMYDLDFGPGTVNYTGAAGKFPMVKYDANANYLSHFELFSTLGAKGVRGLHANAQGEVTVTGRFSDTLNCTVAGNPAFDMASFGDEDIYVASYVNGLVHLDEELESKSVNIFPNPFTDAVTLEFAVAETGNWRLMELSGRILDQGEFQQAFEVAMQPGDLAAGIYLLQIELKDGENIVRKLIAQ